ncbi:MarR family winged helix-turn-helix transcriptional regulator [Prolixibacter sp. SD074]|uniref:MarR family winged helix-turn-helix transcriptional regulator n=1 Tax=Prolixibacter sp. SD074 TaxID=2652391 RepID=UPI00127A0DDF|nr:MarR family transcriptional regulator [Prolixibacter sp. SD074]GET29298.1 MarR family transcriptional regulator [Prolixibacter sp. SD074]
MSIDEEIKGRFRNEYHKGFINLTYTVKLLSYEFHKFLKAHGLTEQQYNVLRILRGFRSRAPLSISFIKQRMLDKNSDVSRIIDRLFEKGLLSRKENPDDRRQKSVKITTKGLELLDKMFICEQKVDTLLKNLSMDEVKQLNYLIDKIREKKE